MHETTPGLRFGCQRRIIERTDVVDEPKLSRYFTTALWRAAGEPKSQVHRRDGFECAQKRIESLPVRMVI
jgi:hypothetical protein